MKFNLFFPSVAYVLGSVSKKQLFNPRSHRFIFMFSSINLKFLGLILVL